MKKHVSMLGLVAIGTTLIACSSTPEHTETSEDDLVACEVGQVKAPRPADWNGERIVGATSVVVPLRRTDTHVEVAVVDAHKGTVPKRVVVASSQIAQFVNTNATERCTVLAPAPPPPPPWCPPDAHGVEKCNATCVNGQIVAYARDNYCTSDAARLAAHH